MKKNFVSVAVLAVLGAASPALAKNVVTGPNPLTVTPVSVPTVVAPPIETPPLVIPKLDCPPLVVPHLEAPTVIVRHNDEPERPYWRDPSRHQVVDRGPLCPPSKPTVVTPKVVTPKASPNPLGAVVAVGAAPPAAPGARAIGFAASAVK